MGRREMMSRFRITSYRPFLVANRVFSMLAGLAYGIGICLLVLSACQFALKSGH